MSQMLNINQSANYDNSISKFEYHSYSPFLNSFNNNDEIRIAIQQQDLYVLPCESFLYIEGYIVKDDGTVSATANLANNSMAYLFEEIRYELNGVEIDRNKNVGHTSTLKNYISLNENDSKILFNAGWSPNNNIALDRGVFNFCVPLKMLLGFAEDYKQVIVKAKHELILNRARNDDNAIVSAADEIKFNISKLQWRIPHITVADEAKLPLLRVIESGRPLKLCFRSWDLYEYPLLPLTTNHTWSVKTSNQIEKPRFVIFGLQTDRKNQKEKDISKFDSCSMVDVKLHLNSESFPYDDLNLRFNQNRYALLYDMYAKFQQSYYGYNSQPLLSRAAFITNAPIAVVDCSHQNESIKTGPVDIKLEFKTFNNVAANTSAYCLILHDRIIEYNPLTNDVRKHV